MLYLEYARTMLKDLILPPADLLLLALLGLLLLTRRPRLGRTLIALALAALWLLSTPGLAGAITRLAERYPPLDLTRPTGAQAVVIFGGGGQRIFAPEYGGPAADPYLLERLAYGAYVARRTGLPILVSGFHIEAIAMRDTLQRLFNLTPRWVDDQSYDTFQNARNTVQLLRADGVQRVILVTRATHSWRAAHELRATGLVVVPGPTGMHGMRTPGPFRWLPDPESLLRSHAALYELIGDRARELYAWTHLRHQ